MVLKISEVEVRCLKVALGEYVEKARKWIEHLESGGRAENRTLREAGVKAAKSDIEAIKGLLKKLEGE